MTALPPQSPRIATLRPPPPRFRSVGRAQTGIRRLAQAPERVAQRIGEPAAFLRTEKIADRQRAAMAPQPQAGGIVFHVAFDAQPVGLQPPDALAALHVDPPHGQRLAVETEILAGPGLAVIVAAGEEDGRHVEAAEAEHRPGALE